MGYSDVRLRNDYGYPEPVRASSFAWREERLIYSPLPSLLRACRYLAWPSLLLSINSIINSHPLRVKEGAQSGVSVILYVLSILLQVSPR